MEYLLMATFGEVMGYIGYIALAVLILLVMITVHEFGHYVAGKIFGFGIEEFAIGFGPKIFSKTKKNGEVFSIRILPIGGFCAFRGEDNESDDPTAFNNKKWWQRIIVLISGALMNFILALLAIILMFSIYGQTALVAYKLAPTENPIYTEQNSFIEKDVLIKADGKNIYLVTDLMDAVANKKAGDTVELLVYRGGKEVTLNLMLRADTDFKNVEDNKTLLTALGILVETNAETGEITNSGLYSTGIKFNFFRTIARSFEYSIKLALSIFTILGQLLTGALGINSLGGTVTTISVTAEAIKVGGFRNLLNITSFIGVNLAVFNLLPIPALDGSRVVFNLIEGITKKPINRRVEGIIHTVGLVLLLAFAVFVDLQQCF
ncbi:MAG: PDZ domain-containing protein [Clostridiales bacterium]|nr:PDZ domain-containing protein [Clostridiales bacterium]